MAVRFRGESLNKVDAKGRVSIPASFRRVLQSADPSSGDGKPAGLVIVYGPASRNHLECFTIEAMAEVDRKISELPRGSKRRRILERIYSGQAVEVIVDEGGRMVLPPKCREKLGALDSAYFIASGDTFQIWNVDTFEAEEAPGVDDLIDDLPEGMDPLELLERELE